MLRFFLFCVTNSDKDEAAFAFNWSLIPQRSFVILFVKVCARNPRTYKHKNRNYKKYTPSFNGSSPFEGGGC